MADEGRVHAAVAVELFFEGEDDERLVDVVADQADASLPPRPELRRDVVDRRDAALFHLAGDAPVECGGVDDDGEVGLAPVGFANQAAIEAEDFRQVAENFGDADDGEIFGVDDGVASGGAHAVAADAEEFEVVGWEGLWGDIRPRLSGGAQVSGVCAAAGSRWALPCRTDEGVCPYVICRAPQGFDQLRAIHFA